VHQTNIPTLLCDFINPKVAMAVSPPTFDLETWATNYDGALLPFRLGHIAINCPALTRTSLTLAAAAAKHGKDAQLYTRLCRLAGQLGMQELATPDAEWLARTEEANRRETARLEGELRSYKNNMIRESIRMGQEDLAKHILLTGGPAADPQSPIASGYNAAYQAFGKMRDFCTTPAHIAGMTLRLLYTAVLLAVSAAQSRGSPAQHWNSVIANATRLRNVGIKEEEQAKLTPISFATQGLAQLGLGNYREAAQAFMQTPLQYNNLGEVYGVNFGTAVASANDVAIYGGLCALATLSRQELIDNVLGGKFRDFLELEPHMRKAISLYTTAKYQACLSTLQRYYSDWRLDIFLAASTYTLAGTHVDALFARIREKSITAYCSSFTEVNVTSLASTFPPPPTSPTAMEDEIILLIEGGKLDARLDVVNGTLVASTGSRGGKEHMDTAGEIERTLQLRLHKVGVSLAQLEIPRSKQAAPWAEIPVNGYS
jgi:COP9 signalosome complex subunit 1